MSLKNLFSRREHWCQGRATKTLNGIKAVCLAQGIIDEYPDDKERKLIFEKVNAYIGKGNDLIRVSAWNDTHSFEDLQTLVNVLDI